MAALPYMQLSIGEYIGSTMHLTTEEHGAYILILMHYWQTESPIPTDRLPVIARMNPARFSQCWAESLESLFREGPSGVEPISIPYRQPGASRVYSPEFERNKSELLRSHSGRCFYCEQESDAFEIDHVLPVVRGGGDNLENLVVACRKCNRSKGSKLVSEWRAS